MWCVFNYLFPKKNRFNQRAVRFVLRDYRARKQIFTYNINKIGSQHLQVVFHLRHFLYKILGEIK